MYQPDPDLYRNLYAELVRSREQERIARRLLKARRKRRAARRQPASPKAVQPGLAAAGRTWSAQH